MTSSHPSAARRLTALLPRVAFITLVAAVSIDTALEAARQNMSFVGIALAGAAILALAATLEAPAAGLFVFVLAQYGLFRYGAYFDDVLAIDLPNRIVLVAVCGWLVRRYETRDPPRLDHWLSAAMFAFVLWVGVTVAAAWMRNGAFGYSMWHHPSQYLQALALFVIAAHVLGRMPVAWSFGLFLTLLPTLQALQRGDRGFYLDNDLPLLSAMLFPLAAVGALAAPHRILRIVFALLGLDLLRIIVFAQNRAAAVGLAAAALALWWNARHRLRWALIGLPAIIVCAWLLVPKSYIDRFAVLWNTQATHQTSKLDQATVKGRLSLWGAAADMLADHPVLGVGAGNFSRMTEQYLPRKTSLPAHSSLLNVAAETGIPGFLLYVTLFAGGLLVLRRAYVRNSPAWTRPLTGALQGSLAAYLAGGLFMSRQDMQLAYMILGWAVALYFLPKDAPAAGAGPTAAPASSRPRS